MKIFTFLSVLLISTQLMAQSGELFPFFAMGENLPEVWRTPDSQKIAGASGQVRVDGNHFSTDQGEIRFWGVNTCFTMNFPDKDRAVEYARRMAKFGINAVRLHHMDSRDIWGKNFDRTMTEIDPDQLDRLDWLIYQFKQNGIYVNINLHVSRKFNKQDGFGSYDDRPSHDKGIDNFEPRMIEFQKKYARDLLSHVNPYTKMSYLEDPCVAMIEINNENSVVASWFWGQLDNLPEEYNVTFQKLWNSWLVKRYGTTAKLREAWGCATFPLEENLIPDGTFEDSNTLKKNANWNLETDEQTRARAEVTPEKTLKITVDRLGTVSWHPQFYISRLSVKEGVPYTLKFRARASQTTKLHSGLGEHHAEWENLGLSATYEVGPEWKDFEFRVVPTKTDDNVRISFNGYIAGATYEFDDISFRAGGVIGLEENQKLETGSVPVIQRKTTVSIVTKAARKDFGLFVIDLENEYWQQMYHFVKDELGAKAPVTGTQLQYGTHYAQARLDYCDIHAYWNHPSFPGRPWDQGNWKLGNTSIVNALGTRGTTVTNLANNRVLGKPYTVSEYNHPYPNLYGAEGFPVISSLAAFQNWSGIYIFAWSHSKEFSPNITPSFFDISGNSVALVHMPACYDMFIRGDVQEAIQLENSLKTVYELGYEQEKEIHAGLSDGYHRSISSIGFVDCQPLLTSVGVRLTDLPNLSDPAMDGVKAFVRPEDFTPPTSTVSQTSELKWNGEVEKNGYYQVDTKNTKIFTGFIHGREFTYADGTKLQVGKTILDWATISLTRTAKNRYLLSATGLMRNTDCNLGEYDPKWIENTPDSQLPSLLDKQISFCKKRGQAPTLCEGIPAVLTLPVAKGKTVVYYPLDGNATRGAAIPARRVNENFVEIRISPEFKTLWYEIEIR